MNTNNTRQNTRQSGPASRIFLVGLLAIGFLLPALPAAAAEFASGFFVGGSYGMVREKSDLQVDKNKNVYAYKGFAGFQFRDYFGVEGGIVDFDNLQHNIGGGVVDHIEIESYFARVYGQLPIMRGNQQLLGIYAAAGAHRWDLEEEIKNNGATTAKFRTHDTSPMFGAGIVLRGRDSSFRLEYELFKDIGQTNKIDLRVIHLSLLFFI